MQTGHEVVSLITSMVWNVQLDVELEPFGSLVEISHPLSILHHTVFRCTNLPSFSPINLGTPNDARENFFQIVFLRNIVYTLRRVTTVTKMEEKTAASH